MNPRRNSLFLLFLALGLGATATAQVTVESSMFGGIEARAIGPATMSGRIAAVDAVGKDPLTIYVGAASGGLWKSTDGGLSFKPVFDDQSQSIGAIAIDPSDKKTVWVGTGETWTRNSVSIGTGLYKTTDGGDTWKLAGLAGSERIARIQIDRKAPKTVFVCATGHLWNANEERGVYKTTDGGETWKRVLYVDADTGCSDLEIDPQDSHVLYAGMWQFRRSPDFFESGGPGSGLFRSTDSGETWKPLTQGLPAGEKGRIAVAVAPSRPSVVYALVEAEKTALYRSDDLGASFREVNSSFNVQARPFYFARLVVDPTDFDRVYKPSYGLGVSEDGGKSFTSPFSGFGGGIHPDHHAFWVNPANPYELLLGTDGGLYQSYDRGSHWRFVRALPVSQFYHVSFDMDVPYNVYGGLQDNGSWMGPSRSIDGIENRDWQNVGGGDGFWVFRDPADPEYVYSEYQGGTISRIRISTREARDIKPQPKAGEPDYRFNWNTPLHLSPNEKGTLYMGAQFLFRTRDHGASWERISPDLTTNDLKGQRQKESGGLTKDNTSAETYTTIFTISESPQNGRVIWAGTDDGNVQVTRDGGQSWTNVVANVPGLPPRTWVSTISTSPFDEATAFATFDGHRSGDMTPYVYATHDFGKTWTSLAGSGLDGYAHVVRQDLVLPELLFVGTEMGLFLSVDGGAHWARFTGNLPKVPVNDIAIHPRENDLILATHGRGVYIVDDITPLRQLTQPVLEADVSLLPSLPQVMPTAAQSQAFAGDDEFVGVNPPEAAVLTYYLKKRHLFGDLEVQIYDADGKLVTTIPGGKRKGLNRVLWPMRLKPPKLPAATNLAPAFLGPRVLEGTYTVKLIKGSDTFTGKVELVADPRSPHSREDRAEQQRLALRLYGLLEDLTYLVETVTDLRDQARERAGKLSKGDPLAAALEAYAKAIDVLHGELVATGEGGLFASEERLREKLAEVYNGVNSFEGKPTQTQSERAEMLAGELAKARARYDALTGPELRKVNERLEKKKLPPLALKTRAEWEAGQPPSSSPPLSLKDGGEPDRLPAFLRGPFYPAAPLPFAVQPFEEH